MSSRTATARKRLEQPHKIPQSRSFFSRSKSANPLTTSSSTPSFSSSSTDSHGSSHRSPQIPRSQRLLDLRTEYSPVRSNLVDFDLPHHGLKLADASEPRLEKSTSSHLQGTCTSTPPTHADLQYAEARQAPPAFRPQTIPVSTPSGPSFVEATYQPPPPSQTAGPSHVLPKKYDIAKLDLTLFPLPPSYPPPSPTAVGAHFVPPQASNHQRISPLSSSPRTHSLSSRASTELPEYATIPTRSSPTPLSRPTLHISTNIGLDSSAVRTTLQPYQDLTSEASVADQTFSSQSNHSSQDRGRKPWYRGPKDKPAAASVPNSPSPTHSPHPKVGLRPPAPASISGSSDSSDRSQLSSGSRKGQHSNEFVFPGGRSRAHPKVSKKTDSPQIKINPRSKSRHRTGQGARPHSPALGGDEQQTSYPIPGRTPMHSVIDLTNPSSEPPSVSSLPLQGHSPVPVLILSPPLASTSELQSVFSEDEDKVARRQKQSNPNAPNSFIFPSSRSRGVPTAPIKMSLNDDRSRKISSSTESSGHDLSAFMTKLLHRKKKGKSTTWSTPHTDSGTSQEGRTPGKPPSEPSHRYNTSQNTAYLESRERARRMKSRIGNYPLDPYDSVLLDNDRHTGELLFRLNPTSSPSFHNYGNTPPASVLDLGCGQGHWVVDAAIAWKGYGTTVTGYDMVDISNGLLPWAIEHEVADSIRFIRGNFLKQRLPFSDESFDFVRMSCLALCITSDSWVFVLQEVCRVLMVGGRLELIDDEMFFPYANVSSAFGSGTSLVGLTPPKLDVCIPSSSFSTFNIIDEDIDNPGLGIEDEPEPLSTDIYGLYGVEEEDDADIDDDTVTVNGDGKGQSRARATPRPGKAFSARPGISYRAWSQAYATSQDLEALFQHMLLHKFGIKKDPSDFVLPILKEVFGHAREMRTMHLSLAPPESFDDMDGERGRQLSTSKSTMHLRSASIARRKSMGVSQTRGLILWPSTFIPMDQSEIEIHASKHLRMLLSCKNLLIEHAVEATNDEEIDEDSVMDALWEYESFLRHRLAPPPPNTSSSDIADPSGGDSAESVSSDCHDAMWEIQTDLRQRFAWSSDRSRSRDRAKQTSAQGNATSAHSVNISPVTSHVFDGHNNSPVCPSSTTTPIYSRTETTNVRTFRIYEAIKIDEAIFGTVV